MTQRLLVKLTYGVDPSFAELQEHPFTFNAAEQANLIEQSLISVLRSFRLLLITSDIMTFLYRSSTSAFRLARLAPRTAFSTSVRTQKSAVNTAKETLKDVDRKVADAAVKGIEKGGMLPCSTSSHSRWTSFYPVETMSEAQSSYP